VSRHGCAFAGQGTAFWERHSPALPVGTDELFSTASMASRTTIQASCQARSAQKSLREQWPMRKARGFRHAHRATKICIRSIVVRRTIIEQTCLKMLSRLHRVGCRSTAMLNVPPQTVLPRPKPREATSWLGVLSCRHHRLRCNAVTRLQTKIIAHQIPRRRRGLAIGHHRIVALFDFRNQLVLHPEHDV